MKRKTGAREHTIIIGTILASILVFVLGFFLGRVWVLMPQEKMVKDKKTTAPVVTKTEQEFEFEESLDQLKEQKLRERLKREQEAKEKVKEVMEQEKERKEKLALLRESQEEEEREKKLEEKRKRDKLVAQERERELNKKREEEQKRKLEEEQKRKQKEEAQKILEAKRKIMMEEKAKAVAEKPKPLEEKHTPPPSPPTLAEGEYFTLQLQSSPNKERVEEFLTQLRTRGYPAYVIQVDLKEKGIWYRIRLGKYSSQEEAIKSGESLKSQGIISHYWITKK